MKTTAPGGNADTGRASFRTPRLAPWPVPDATAKFSTDVSKPLKVEELGKNAKSATDPIYVRSEAVGYDAAWPAALARPEPSHLSLTVPEEHMPRGNVQVRDVLLCFLVPPLEFALVAQVLTFHLHFSDDWLAWLIVGVAFLPVAIALRALKKKPDCAWMRLLSFQLLIAFVVACPVSNMNFWYCMYPFYSVRSMKSYRDIDPAQVSGQRLMDAGKVRFVDNARIVTDLAMSFTTWDVYCVAPISTPYGLPSQGSQLASYDFWAVGVGCCKSGTPSFSCGEYQNTEAHSGLRAVDKEQTHYFELAVQQAEAAYGVRATHPVFIYWVSDADSEESLLFENGFKNWIFACSSHFTLNVVATIFNFMAFHKPEKKMYFTGLSA